jgi:hypothetical protein
MSSAAPAMRFGPGMPHDRVLRAIALLGERVLPHFA